MAEEKIDKFTKYWFGREFLAEDDGAVYLFLEKPTKGYFGGSYYFWRVSDPSLKIRVSAGIAHHLKVEKGSLHPLLHATDTLKRKV